VGRHISIAGTAPIASDGTGTVGRDAYEQTKRCLGIIEQAIAYCGGSLADVTRTRIMLTDISKWKDAAQAHGERFSDIRPACTFCQVVGFIDPEWLVEVEADAVLPDD
jgi:enamine deaminase RidA (YjgF/YER057c/UK114 family)